ncbi:MAG: hypothetical protein QXD04_04355 [Candidatus Bathyarchaeia archaeon]
MRRGGVDGWGRLLQRAREARRAGRLGLLVIYKRGLASSNPDARTLSDPWFRLLVEELKDIPAEGYTCECCGYRGLVNVHIRDGHIVGPECANHPFGSCRGR